MKSKHLQNIVISKRQNDDGPTKIFRDFKWRTLFEDSARWEIKLVQSVAVVHQAAHASFEHRPPLTKWKTDWREEERKLSKELKLSRTRILKDDLRYFPYKIIIKPFLIDAHQAERKRFANWLRSNFRQEILFLDEKLFHIDGVYNVAFGLLVVSRQMNMVELKWKESFHSQVMAWLGASHHWSFSTRAHCTIIDT